MQAVREDSKKALTLNRVRLLGYRVDTQINTIRQGKDKRHVSSNIQIPLKTIDFHYFQMKRKEKT